MTPFGKRVREMRTERRISLKTMAHALDVTPAYLSALEHGHRGKPSHNFIQRTIAFFNVIWDEAEDLERLAEISHPKVTIDTSGIDPLATELANKLAASIADVTPGDLKALILELEASLKRNVSAIDRG